MHIIKLVSETLIAGNILFMFAIRAEQKKTNKIVRVPFFFL
jgi:hypothetical protein